MRIVRQSLWAIGLLVVSGVCSSCSPDLGTPKAALTDQQRAEAATKQGKGGVKSTMGGGVMPAPEVAKPGEHVGPPPPGGKTGG